MKKIIIITISIFLISLFTQSAWAKSPRRHRGHRGAGIIGLGAIIFGGILLHNHRHPHPNFHTYPKHYHSDQLPPGCSDYIREKVWIPPTYRYTHILGRYDQHGNWIPEKSKRWKVRSGHWETKLICRSYEGR